ncbi:MAG: DNA-binding response regulator, partial [Thermoanaerobaculia bacterium]
MAQRDSEPKSASGNLIPRLRADLLAELAQQLEKPLQLTVEGLRDVENGLFGELDPRALEQLGAARRNAERARDLLGRSLEACGSSSEDRGEVGERGLPLVLLVDDDPVMLAFLREHLETGYRLAEASGGAEALHRARELLPDLIVSDVMMPGMDGYAFCHQLKQDPELDFIPLILLTAKVSSESKVAGFQEGADGWLTKPVELAELRARIDNLIASRRRLLERFERSAETPAATGLPIAEGVCIDAEGRSFLERVKQLLAEHLGDQDFSVDALAHGLAMDRTYLFRRLRELTGFTPSALIRELRLATAARCLAAGKETVSEIAWSVGFKDVS